MTFKNKSLGFFQYLTLQTLWHDSFPQSCQLLAFLTSSLQSFAILINYRFSFLKTSGHDAFSKAVDNISQVITLDRILLSSKDNLLIAMFLAWVYLCVLIFVILYLLYTHHYQRGRMAGSSRIMTCISQFHVSIGFFWTSHILLKLNQDGLLESIGNNEEILAGATWTRELNWVFLVVSYLFGGFFAIYSFDPFMSMSLFASHNSVFQTFTFVLKAFAVPFLCQSNDSKLAMWVFVIFMLVLACLRLYYLFEYFPYYQEIAMKCAISGGFICTFMAFSNFLAVAFSDDSRIQAKIFCYLDLLLIPLSIKVGNIWFEKAKMMYLRMPDEKLKSEEAVLKKLFFLRCLISQFNLTISENQKFNIHEVYFWSVFVNYDKIHKKLNWINDVRFTGIGNVEVEKLKDIQSKFGEMIIKDLLENSIQRIRQSNKIKTLFIYSFLDRPEYLSCLIYFLSTLSRSRGYSQILVTKLEVKIQAAIEKFFNDREGKVLNIKSYLDMQTISSSFLNKIHQAGKAYEDFWTYYNRSGLKMTILYEKSSEIENFDDQIQYQWKKAIEINLSFAKLLSGVYSMYLSLIRNCPYSAQRIFDKYWSSLGVSSQSGGDLTNSSLYDERNITIHASMSKERLGKILYVSPNIAESIGFQHQNLVGKNVNVLMPSFTQENHNQILIEHLNKVGDVQSTTMLYSNIDTFVLNRDGFISPCKLYLSVHPYIQKELVYVAMIKIKDTTHRDMLLVGDDGNIQGYTQNAGLQLGLNGSKKFHIQEICKGYSATMKSEDQIANKRLAFLLSKTKCDILSFLRKIMIEEQSEKGELLKNSNLSLNLISIESRPSVRNNPKAFATKLRIEEICGNKTFILEFEKLSLENSSPSLELTSLPKEDEAEDGGIPEERSGAENELPLTSPSNSHAQFLFGKQRETENALLSSNRVFHFTEALSPRAESKIMVPSFANAEDDKKMKVEREGKVQKHLLTKQDEDDEVLSLTSSKNAYAVLERSIQGASQNEKLNKLKILAFLLLIFSSVLLIILEEENGSALEHAETDIEILNHAIMRTADMTLIGRLAIVELMSVAGLFLDTRYLSIGYVYPMKYIAMIDMANYAGWLNEENNRIRSSLYQIDKDLQGELYDNNIPVYNSDDGVNIQLEKSVNLFDLTDEIIARAMKAFNTPVSEFTIDNPDLIFLINNTFNGGIMMGEEVVRIIQEDGETKLEHRETISRVMIILMSLIGLFLVLVVTQIQLKFLKKRNQLTEIFLHLDSSPFRQFELLERFLEDLEQSYMDCNYFNLKMKKDQGLMKNKTLKTQNSRSNPNQTNAKVTRRTGEMTGINTRLLVIWILVFLFALSLCIIFISLFPIVDAQNEKIKSKNVIMAQSSLTLYKFKLMRAMLYYYIFSNGTASMKEQLISDQWDSLVNDLARSPSFFLNQVLDTEHGMGDNEELVSLVKGNICKIIYSNDAVGPFCASLGGGVLTGGILSFNSFALAALRESKQVFDSSSRTFDDMEKAIDVENLILVEIMESSFMESVYSVVNDLTEKQLIQDIQDAKDSFLKVVIIYIILSLVFGNLIWLMIVTALEREMSNANKLLKRIPIPLIVNNKLLQNYLAKNNKLADVKK